MARKIQISSGQRGIAVRHGRLVAKAGDQVVVSDQEFATLTALVSSGAIADLGSTSDPLTDPEVSGGEQDGAVNPAPAYVLGKDTDGTPYLIEN